MRNYIITLLIVASLSSCKQDDEIISKNGRVDLTRNILYEARWGLVIPILDSIDTNGGIYFSSNFPVKYELYSIFGLQSINKEYTKYLRSREVQDPNGPGFIYYSDTIEVQTWNNDSIVCRSIEEQNNDTSRYSKYTFHGKYNNTTKNVEGFIDGLVLSYRCPTCPGMVYRYYEGKVPALFIPINY
jgi:hypothetical protein